MKRMGKSFHPGSIWLHLQHSSDSGRQSDGLIAAAMPALVQAVTTSYMQDGKQVLELMTLSTMAMCFPAQGSRPALPSLGKKLSSWINLATPATFIG